MSTENNFLKDNQDLLFHLEHKDIERVILLKEENFKQKELFPEAPLDKADALDNYKRVLNIVGEITGSFIAPRAPQVDTEGATFKDGEVYYAKGTAEAIDRLKKSDLLGFTLPREYGGLNFPKVIYSMAIEMISRADASLMNIFGLQDIAETIYHFGTEDQKKRYLPRFCSGEVLGSMSLTEPDAGSDLQAAQLKATQDPNTGLWTLNGVKRFITNGCAQISLVMARSEEGSSDGRGLSLFVYDRDDKMKIRRIEHKLGIHGSPTCELQFNNAPAELLGKRKFGLIKYTMSLMNGARLGVSAQAVGIAEAAYREAYNYALKREQFKKKIYDMPPVYEMLTDMKVSIEAGRTLLLEAATIVDIKEGLEEKMEKHPEIASDLKDECQRYTQLAALYTPLLKSTVTEMSNKVAYDALQIHGGVGYTCEFNIERHVRDARITNIYEGTTQMQVVAAIGGVMKGNLFERLSEYESKNDFSPIADLFERAHRFRSQLEKAVSHVKLVNEPLFQEFHARRLVEMASDVTCSYLLCIDALKSERKKKIAELFTDKAANRLQANLDFILSNDRHIIEQYEEITKI